MASKHSQWLAFALLLAVAVAAVTAWTEDHEVRKPGSAEHVLKTWAVCDLVHEHTSLCPGQGLHLLVPHQVCTPS